MYSNPDNTSLTSFTSFTILPLEVVRVISLHLKPATLAVNLEYTNIYKDDNWYQERLQLLHPGMKLFKQTTYKDLYTKYLQNGDIYIKNTYSDDWKLDMKGIKTSVGYGGYAILTFNGDLYRNNKLIDTEVIDICSNGYIKSNEYYLNIGLNNWRKESIPGGNCISIVEHLAKRFVLTKNGVCCVCVDSQIFVPVQNPVYQKLLIREGFTTNLYVVDNNDMTYLIDFEQQRAIPMDYLQLIPHVGFFDTQGYPLLIYPCYLNAEFVRTHLPQIHMDKIRKVEIKNNNFIVLHNNLLMKGSIDTINSIKKLRITNTIFNVKQIYDDMPINVYIK